MRFYGLQKLSMVDCPGKLAATVFTGGCNLRCPFCHNASLVTHLAPEADYSEAEILAFLQKRKGFLEALVLSGGEPLLHPGSLDFLRKVKALGYYVKLDTNGCFPQALAAVLEEGLADYVAMDIKNSRERYAETTGIPTLDLPPIDESIALLRRSGVDYEFRTTVVRELHEEADILAICRWLQGSKRWCLQNFVDSGDLISPGLHSPEESELRRFADISRTYFGEILLRGI